MASARFPHRRLLIVLLAMLWHSDAVALDPSLDVSQYAHKAWKIRDGFPAGYAESFAQTPDGYLWLGTEFGLVRFDGVRGVDWQPSDNQQLPSNSVRALLVGRDGSLWIGTSKGLARWRGGKLTAYPPLAGYLVYSVREDANGVIWAGGNGTPVAQLCAIRDMAGECTKVGGTATGVAALHQDPRGDLWVGTSRGLLKWNSGPSTLAKVPGEDERVLSLVEGADGHMLVGTGRGLFRFANDRFDPDPLLGQGIQITRLLRDRDGGLWVGTRSHGLFHLRRSRVDHYGQTEGLSGDIVTALFEDREGTVWVATTDGIDRFRDLAIPTISAAQGLSGAIWSVVATDDGIWAAGDAGISRWKDGDITAYYTQSRRAALVNSLQEAPLQGHQVKEVRDAGLDDQKIQSMAKDYRGRIWVSTNQGVFRLDGDRFVQVPGIAGGLVHAIATDPLGSVWLSDGTEGLVHLLGDRVVAKTSWAALGVKRVALSLLVDGLHGGVWLGLFEGGVVRFHDGRVKASYGSQDGLGGGSVTDLFMDGDGVLWAATQAGLSRIREGRVSTLTSRNGLPCDGTRWVTEDDKGSFWLAMACGLVRIAHQEMDAWSSDTNRRIRVTVFDGTDGVVSHAVPDAYSPHVAKSADGRLWFARLDGLSVIDPSRLAVNEVPPAVHVEQVIADRKTYAPSGQLRLPPLLRDLEIEYTALSLVAPEKNRFRYKLEGRDDDWQDAGNRRQAFYTDLDPGNYRFRVIASNNSGVWNEQGATLNFSIAPAYWQTNWFRALCAAVLAALLWTLYVLRVHQLARQFNLTLEARVNERTRIARELHDTLLQSFHGLLLRFQTARDMVASRPREAVEVLDGAIDQAIDAVTEGRQAVQGLRSSTEETNDLADAVRGLGNALAAEQGAGPDVTLRIDAQGTPRELHPIVRDELVRIAGEAMRNAFRHAEAKQVEVEIRYDDRRLKLHVRDDGKGIDAETLKAGAREGHFGLPGMRERARLIGAKLTVWSRDEQGTEVEVSIPAAHAYAPPLPGTGWRDRFGSVLHLHPEPRDP